MIVSVLSPQAAQAKDKSTGHDISSIVLQSFRRYHAGFNSYCYHPPPPPETPVTKSALVAQGWGILQVSLVPGVGGGDNCSI